MLQRRRLSGGCYPVLESEPRLAAPQSNSAVQHQGGGGGRGVVDFGTRVHPRPKSNQATLWLKPRLATRTAWWGWSSLKQSECRTVGAGVSWGSTPAAASTPVCSSSRAQVNNTPTQVNKPTPGQMKCRSSIQGRRTGVE